MLIVRHQQPLIIDTAAASAVYRHDVDGLRHIRGRCDPRRAAALDAVDPVIDVWGDTALARHWLTVRFAGGPEPLSVRVTTVWRQVDGRWLAVHNHEDVRATPR